MGQTHIVIDEIKKKLFWIESSRRFSLAARAQVQQQELEIGLSEKDVDPIQEWCQKHDCGKRISFDTFQFRNRREMSFFLLRWSDQNLDQN